MKILLDALGGDKAPASTVAGAIEALNTRKDLEIVLAGPEATLRPMLEKGKAPMDRVSFLEAKQAVLNTDHPSVFLKEKPDSSLAVAFEALRKDDSFAAMVSAGPTGALLTGTVLRIGRIQGVLRPGLLAVVPTRTGKVCHLVDVGANMDCKPEYLYQFAVMADAYLRLSGLASPRIATLSVGMEEGKGNELSKAAYELIKANPKLNFVGNIEGDHVLRGEADIVICDGFSGNVFLKSLEEGAYFIADLFQAAIKKNIITKFGALFQLRHLKKVKEPFNYASKASSPLLGAKKIVLKCHGKADGETLAAAILKGCELKEKGLLEQIGETLKGQEQD